MRVKHPTLDAAKTNDRRTTTNGTLASPPDAHVTPADDLVWTRVVPMRRIPNQALAADPDEEGWEIYDPKSGKKIPSGPSPRRRSWTWRRTAPRPESGE